MIEYIIEVDEKDKEVGPIEKMEAHYKGVLHRAFSIFIFNSEGQLLLQKRNSLKYHSGGLWTNSCCSHPRFGEPLHEAIYRRLEEEMGFTCKLKEVFSFLYKVEFEDKLIEHEYDHVFFGTFEGEIKPNEEEVEAYKWVDLHELKEDINKHPELYTFWFKHSFERVLKERLAELKNKNIR